MGSSSPAPQPYQPPNQAGVAAAFQQGAGSLASQGQNLYNQANQGYNSIYQGMLTNPYYAGAQASANTTAAQGTAFGNQELGWGQGLANLAGSLGQYAPGIAATAFDPQNALYNRTAQQLTDQSRAGAAQMGLGSSPFGAGVTNQALSNFNIDWQNNQQQRQNAGVAALGQLGATQSGLYTDAGNLGTAGLNALTESGQLPQQVYEGHMRSIEEALNALVQGSNAASSQQQSATADYGQYLEIGQQASQGALNAWQAQQQANNSFWGGIGGLFGDVLGFGLF